MATELKANKRNTTKRSYITQLRQKGDVPAVVYGSGTEPQSVAVTETEFIKVIKDHGMNGVISLVTDDKQKLSVMVQEIQRDHLKNEVRHIDFIVVDLQKAMEADVPLTVTGESPGVKEGGVLQRILHTVTVKAKPNDFPDHIEVNAENLNIGDSLLVKDLQTSSSYEIVDDQEEVVLTVTPPTVADTEVEDDEDREEAEADPGGDAEGKAVDEEDKGTGQDK
ncbi:50S ribosomal protein L25/general stress protein Ctc [Fictibacillus terranigra]|uniref:Large ribosomal subunit protein bL25 n=1 Tax=Fictibacillus terranigra TaxID=3058424 RepID=A0ABT8EEA2_9BACL|nr:50S ribosomal protein L25/general stress protein Ctc [Fictibacillus sp. CENA-BCM004]MDN4076244.1 50S ribosomal protein L25/general stress protein Ctc [Fictibacillus sp. CENA-BCM004]